jgi:hypothetical protein
MGFPEKGQPTLTWEARARLDFRSRLAGTGSPSDPEGVIGEVSGTGTKALNTRPKPLGSVF